MKIILQCNNGSYFMLSIYRSLILLNSGSPKFSSYNIFNLKLNKCFAFNLFFETYEFHGFRTQLYLYGSNNFFNFEPFQAAMYCRCKIIRG